MVFVRECIMMSWQALFRALAGRGLTKICQYVQVWAARDLQSCIILGFTQEVASSGPLKQEFITNGLIDSVEHLLTEVGSEWFSSQINAEIDQIYESLIADNEARADRKVAWYCFCHQCWGK